MGYDVQTRKCVSCPQTFKLATLMSRDVYCPACHRAKALAEMEARKHETAVPLGGVVIGGRSRDASAVGVAKPDPMVRSQPILAMLSKLDPACEWRDDDGRVHRVVWEDVGGQRRNDGLTWASGAHTADMPDGRVLCVLTSTGYVFGASWKLLTGQIAAPSHEKARAAALAKWRELAAVKPATSQPNGPSATPENVDGVYFSSDNYAVHGDYRLSVWEAGGGCGWRVTSSTTFGQIGYGKAAGNVEARRAAIAAMRKHELTHIDGVVWPGDRTELSHGGLWLVAEPSIGANVAKGAFYWAAIGSVGSTGNGFAASALAARQAAVRWATANGSKA